MPVSPPSYEEILARAWNSVKEHTGITAESESSFAYNIVKVCTQELRNLWVELERVDSQSSLSTAVGNSLDLIGNFFGVTRRSSLAATTLGSPQSVKFTNNGGTSVTIPNNTRVWPSSSPEIAYFTVGAVNVAAGGEGYVDVRAAAPGENYNIGARQLDTHSLGYVTLSVTNETPISNGSDVESDVNYRVRIKNEILAREGANLTSLRQALLLVPGVRDIQLFNLARGTGTIDALLYGYDRIIPQEVVDECQRVGEEVVSAGISFLAKAPVPVYIDITARLIIRPNGSFGQAKAAASTAIRGYVDNIPLEDGTGSGTLIFQELASRIQQSHIDILDSSVILTIDDLPSLRSNQTLDIGERFTLRTITII